MDTLGLVGLAGFFSAGFGFLHRELHRVRDELKVEAHRFRDKLSGDIADVKFDLKAQIDKLAAGQEKLTERYIQHLERHR